jgi:plastocyanin
VVTRNIYLKIEEVLDYSPVDPEEKVSPPKQYRRDCMRNPGHEDTTIPLSEVNARRLTALVYREYLDSNYLIPKPDKLVLADVNEPVYAHRVPGTVIYTRPGERLRIHVKNADLTPHSLHVHGLLYGIDSDGAWPLGTQNTDGRRSDEICPGQIWIYTFDVTDHVIGAWPFHDHYRHIAESINRGLFGGIVVRPREHPDFPPPMELPPLIKDFLRDLGEETYQVPAIRDAGAHGDTPPKATHTDAEPVPEHQSHHHMKVDDFEVQTRRMFLEEWTQLSYAHPKPKPEDVLHVPLFFHFMSRGHGSPAFDSGSFLPGAVPFEVTFGVEGTFTYHCERHPNMQGKVTVVVGGASIVDVYINDSTPPFAFNQAEVTIQPGGRVRWHPGTVEHTVTEDGAGLPSYCFNGRSFVGNTPTIVAHTGQKIRWYVFNLDLGMVWHNFHPHAQRWHFANEALDTRSIGPAESFVVETTAPPVLLLPEEIAEAQEPEHRPKHARKYILRGDFLFHCHVEMHMTQGLAGLVRSQQSVWLTPEQARHIAATTGLPLDDGENACPDVDLGRCDALGCGKWEEIPGIPQVTQMHAALLPNTMKVLYWGYGDVRDDISRIWDYSTPTGAYSLPANQPFGVTSPLNNLPLANIWSAEHAFLDNMEGTLLAHGGFTPRQSYLFHPSTLLWSRTAETTEDRFYSTSLTLADGKVLTLFGSASRSIEVYNPMAGTWSMPKPLPASFNYVYYPWTYLLPGGDLFIAGPTGGDPPAALNSWTRRFDWTATPIVDDPTRKWQTIGGTRNLGPPPPADPLKGGEKGTSVLLPLRPPNYEARVLIAGGNTPTTQQTAEMIDLSLPLPAWTALPNLNQARPQQVNSVLLPDGRVFLAGGIDGVGGPTEIFDPRNPSAGWMLCASMKYPRGYHSSAILLADGSVLMGGDRPGAWKSGELTPSERYFPSYYFQPRPVITSAPTGTTYGSSFTIQTPSPSAIAEVVLLRPGAVTHGFNMSQRFVGCAIAGSGGTSLNVQAPSDRTVAPPGYYLLFIVDSSRVPSIGHWIRLHP